MSDFKAKMHQIRFRLGLRPRPRWGSLQRSPDPWLDLRSLLLREGREMGGREGEEKRKEKGRGGSEGRGRERKEKGGRKGGKGGWKWKGKGREGEREGPPHCVLDKSNPVWKFAYAESHFCLLRLFLHSV